MGLWSVGPWGHGYEREMSSGRPLRLGREKWDGREELGVVQPKSGKGSRKTYRNNTIRLHH
jgi:hypothetical protein